MFPLIYYVTDSWSFRFLRSSCPCIRSCERLQIVSYNENVYEGMLHNYESYSNEPHIVLTSYIVKDKSDNVLDDFRDDNTKIIILDTSEAEKVEVIYAKNSTICKDLRELCNSNSSLFNDRNNEEQD